MLGDRIPHSALPTAEIGTAHMELTMAIRKTIAQQLNKAAKAIENDKSKEQIGVALFTARVALANAIMPKQFNMPTKR